jgi:acyl-CoA synthetase (NDP forming)
MFPRLAVVLAILLTGFRPASARAAESATASLTGRVSNAATGAYLQRARVAVRGTELLAFTDDTASIRRRPPSRSPPPAPRNATSL